MAKRSTKQPADINQLAKSIVDRATDDEHSPETQPKKTLHKERKESGKTKSK
jgi:hypothetical protein